MPFAIACLVLLAVLAPSPVEAGTPRGAAALRGVAAAVRRTAWQAPLRPLEVRRFFEPPPRPWLPGHRGVDLAGYPGQVVHAAGAGSVGFAGPLAGRGVVSVVHGELRTTYEPVEPLVAAGDTVLAGEPIALLARGHPPSSGVAARLHWGLLRGRTYLDPLRLLGRRPSRLLPLASPSRVPAAAAAARPYVRPTAPPAADTRKVAGAGRTAGGALALAALGLSLATRFGPRAAPGPRRGREPP